MAGKPLIESTFLRDIHRWAMNGNHTYMSEVNEQIENLSNQATATRAGFRATDDIGSHDMKRIAST